MVPPILSCNRTLQFQILILLTLDFIDSSRLRLYSQEDACVLLFRCLFMLNSQLTSRLSFVSRVTQSFHCHNCTYHHTTSSSLNAIVLSRSSSVQSGLNSFFNNTDNWSLQTNYNYALYQSTNVYSKTCYTIPSNFLFIRLPKPHSFRLNLIINIQNNTFSLFGTLNHLGQSTNSGHWNFSLKYWLNKTQKTEKKL